MTPQSVKMLEEAAKPLSFVGYCWGEAKKEFGEHRRLKNGY